MEATDRTREDLAFDQVLSALAKRCRTEAGRERAFHRPLLAGPVEVKDALQRVEEARSLAREPFSLPLGGVSDIRTALERAAKAGVLEPRDLVACAQTLFAFARTREALLVREATLPALAVIGRRLPVLEKLALRVDRCFDASGEISDSASDALKEARDRARGLHRHIKAKLDVMLHDVKFLTNLREGYYTLRNGRYVLPVLSQQQAEIPGIVHNASQSGQTLFVEPQPMVGLGNELAIAQSVVEEEERRVLEQLTLMLKEESPAILDGALACAELDEAEAAALLSNELAANSPKVESADGPLNLRQLRHPLLVLAGKEVVANDVAMTGDVRAMVISGPNAGGKTVTLKAVGLSALMLRVGLPIAADDGSVLPLYNAVQSAVGDAQDLAQGLSTFSAHVLALKAILETTQAGCLALIDEIAADTDPREGAAIAIAVLQELIDQGARVMVTTHLEEVKALTHLDARFINARVGFDARKMLPTFRLQMGVPGASSAIDVAARMGLAAHIIDRARSLVTSSGGAMAQALASAETDRRYAAEELEKAKATAQAAEQQKQALEEERAALTRERRAEEARLARSTAERAQEAEREVAAILNALQNEASLKAATEAKERIRAIGNAAAVQVRAAEADLARAEAPRGHFQPAVGLWAHHAGLQRDVEILELDGDAALVSAGALKMRATTADLSAPRAKRPQSQFPSTGRRLPSSAQSSAPAELLSTTLRCDVRGLRADEALREVGDFLDRAFRAGDAQALILHGHGTGTLREMIRDYLTQSPYVRIFRPGEPHEGGNGVTIVALRN